MFLIEAKQFLMDLNEYENTNISMEELDNVMEQLQNENKIFYADGSIHRI